MRTWTRLTSLQVRALLFALSCVSIGCIISDRRLAARAGAPDGALDGGADGGTDGGTGAPFGTPVIVSGLRGDTDVLQDPTLSADELEIYFMSVTGTDANIWTSRRALATDPWPPASVVAELSTASREEDPDLAPDGLSIYFSSDRGGDAGAMRLWFARRAARNQPWGPPEDIRGLGTSTMDVSPSVDASGVRLVFASMRDGLDFQLFVASRTAPTTAWEQGVELAVVNSTFQDRDPALFGQGSGLVFSSRRTGQGRTSDLFQIVAPDPGAGWAGVPAPINELNTDAWEGDAWMSQEGDHIVFVSDRSGTPRIYEARR